MDEMNYDKMGKDALRAECRDREIPYGKLNNDGMRAALRADDAAHKEFADEHSDFEMTQAELDRQVDRRSNEVVVELASGPVKVDLNKLAIDPSKHPGGLVELPEADRRAIGDEAASRPKPAPRTRKGVTIERDREERNGVKRPSKGGVCREVWDYCDRVRQSGPAPTAKDVRAEAERNGWNPNNAMIEFYQWRKFNGITGRVAK